MTPSFIEPREARLGNGMRVVLAPDPGRAAVGVSIRYDVGSRSESPDRTGLAHLTEHLMFTGSPGVAAGEHLRLVQSLGGIANAVTSMDSTCYYQIVPAEALDLVLWLEADRLSGLAAALTRASLDVQRGVVKNERRQTLDDTPHGNAREEIVAELFPAPHPYHHLPLGSMTHLDRASLDDVRGFIERHYRPERAVVTITGGFAPEQALDRLEHHLGWISGGRPARRPRTGPPPPAVRHPVRLDDRTDRPPRIFIGYPLPAAGTAEFDAARLAATLLARGTGNRLTRGLVRDRELATDVSFGIVPLTEGNSLGLVQLVPRRGVAVDRLEAVYFAEIRALAEHPPPEAELARAKAQFRAAWLDHLDDLAGRTDELSWHALLRGDAAIVGRTPGRFDAITAEDVARAARSWTMEEPHVVLRCTDGSR